jgi:uncharacterized protein
MEWVPDWASSSQYVNLVTFKRDGNSVTTAVWFALDNGKLYIYSNLNAGKMKRVRNNGAVEVGPCDIKGKPTGPTVAAQATELPESSGPYVHGLLNKKYGWRKRIVSMGAVVPELLRIRKRKPDGFIEVSFGA